MIAEIGVVGDIPGTRISGRREERVNPGRGSGDRKGKLRDRIGTGLQIVPRDRHRRRTQIIASSKHTGIHAVRHRENKLIWPPGLGRISETRIDFIRDVEKTMPPGSRFQPIGEAGRLIAGECQGDTDVKYISRIDYRPVRDERECLRVGKSASNRYHSRDNCDN